MSLAEAPPKPREPRVVRRETPPYPAAFIDFEGPAAPRTPTRHPQEAFQSQVRRQASEAVVIYDAAAPETHLD